MDLGLKGKVAVVTGGSVGIGLAIAEGLAAEKGWPATSPLARGRTTSSTTSSGFLAAPTFSSTTPAPAAMRRCWRRRTRNGRPTGICT
jgi:hypothetical protein